MDSNQPEAVSYGWPKSPYKGLSYYTPRDAALFGARAADVRACARLLVKESTQAIILHGTTGSGKSSFLRAGLIPYLESEVSKFQFLARFDPTSPKALFIRCTKDPLARVCETLYDWSQLPFMIAPPDSSPEEIDLSSVRKVASNRKSFVRKVARSPDELANLLVLIGRLVPKTLVLILDQSEEIITLNNGERGSTTQKQFFTFLSLFNNFKANIKIVVALRTEYFGMFNSEVSTRRDEDSGPIPDFLLRELTDKQLIEAIKMPTSTTVPKKFLMGRCQPREHYKFSYEPGVPDAMVSDLATAELKGGALPILQVECDRLYRLTKGRRRTEHAHWVITLRDYRLIGAPQEQIDKYLMETLERGVKKALPNLSQWKCEEEVARWIGLLYRMVKVEADNRMLTMLTHVDAIRSYAKEYLVSADSMIEFLADEDQRILRPPENVSDDESSVQQAFYSLGHDSLAIAVSRARERWITLDHRKDMLLNAVVFATRGVAGVCFAIAIPVGIYFYSTPDSSGSDLFKWGVATYTGVGGFIWLISKPLARLVLFIRRQLENVWDWRN